MTRRPMMAGNWKMNKTTSEAVRLSQGISLRYDKGWEDRVDVVLCPPSICLKPVSNVLDFDRSPMMLGAQNCHWETAGAFTGEISPAMLKEAGCTWCIVGHSERREMFGETDTTVNLKVKALLDQGVGAIVCCGETIETHEAGGTEAFVCGQIEAAFAGVPAHDAARCVIAYEPIWAIGTGHVPTPEVADQVCHALRRTVAALYGEEVADGMRILYGGSMKPGNVGQFLPMPDIDGGLIGGAALEVDTFVDLIKACL